MQQPGTGISKVWPKPLLRLECLQWFPKGQNEIQTPQKAFVGQPWNLFACNFFFFSERMLSFVQQTFIMCSYIQGTVLDTSISIRNSSCPLGAYSL